MDLRPAGELETLGVDPSIAPAPTSDPLSPLTLRMKLGLIAATALFVLGGLTQLLAALWALCLTAIIAGAGTILVHTGGLEPKTFATCSVLALCVAIAALVGIVLVWLQTKARGEPWADDESFYVRRPVVATSLTMLAALAIVTVAGVNPSPYFPYPLATIVVLANAYYFAVFVVVVCAWAANVLWGDLARWAAKTRYRAGFLTATFALLGTAGVVLGVARWYEAPLDDAKRALETEKVKDPTGFFDAEIKGLCLAAGEILPSLATSASAAPACGFLPGSETRQVTDCFEKLADGPLEDVRVQIAKFERVPRDLRHDVVMNAAIITCTRVPPPSDLAAYLSRVAQNEAARMSRSDQNVSCEDVEDFEAPRCDAIDREDHAAMTQVWETAMCSLTRREAAIVRWRLGEDEPSFRDIGKAMRIPESLARDTFYNAIKKLRRLGVGACFREES